MNKSSINKAMYAYGLVQDKHSVLEVLELFDPLTRDQQQEFLATFKMLVRRFVVLPSYSQKHLKEIAMTLNADTYEEALESLNTVCANPEDFTLTDWYVVCIKKVLKQIRGK